MWELIQIQGAVITERLSVHGGWIVRTNMLTSQGATHQIFVQDTCHEWELCKKEN